MTKGKISIRQLQMLLLLDVFGTGVIALPRLAAGFAGNDGWLLAIGATLFTLCYALVINSLAGMFPLESFAEYSQRIIGRPLGIIISITLAAKLIFTAGVELRIFGEIIRQTMLYKTPIWATCGAMAVLGAYLIYKGYETRARLAEILFFVVFAPLVLILTATASNSDLTNILPAFKAPVIDILTGSFYISLTLRGTELVLLVYPLVNKPLEIKKGHLKAVIATGVVMLATTFVTIVKFGAEDVKVQLWPVIRLMDAFNVPGGFFERLDATILSIWIISILISTSAGLFFSSYIFEGVFGGKRVYILPCAGAVFAVSMFPRNITQAYNLLAVCELTAGVAFLLFIPSALLIIARLRGIGRDKL